MLQRKMKTKENYEECLSSSEGLNRGRLLVNDFQLELSRPGGGFILCE